MQMKVKKLLFNALILALFASQSHYAIAAEKKASVKEALKTIELASKKATTDALIIWQDGKIVADWRSKAMPDADQMFETMSATKGVAALAIGLLMKEGKIKSLDQPVADFYPEWRQGKKASITIRHLMAHTSGLQNVRTTVEEIYPSSDFVQLALTAELNADPGAKWAYNNKATNLIAGVVLKASGKPMDEYMKSALFIPLGMNMEEVNWVRDKAGNPHGMSGFQISAREFLKLGIFVLNDGKVGAQQLIDPSFFKELAKPGNENQMAVSGHLWWLVSDEVDVVIDDELIERMKSKGVEPSFIEKMVSLKGSYGDDMLEDTYIKKMTSVFGKDYQAELQKNLGGKVVFPKMKVRSVRGIKASGSFGQELIVIPDQKLVIARLVNSAKPKFDTMGGSFSTLEYLAIELANAYRDEKTEP
jgi:CubicO group peptidase (beta-lactamase class C family)